MYITTTTTAIFINVIVIIIIFITVDSRFIVGVDFGSSFTSSFSWHTGFTRIQNCIFRKLRR